MDATRTGGALARAWIALQSAAMCAIVGCAAGQTAEDHPTPPDAAEGSPSEVPDAASEADDATADDATADVEPVDAADDAIDATADAPHDAIVWPDATAAEHGPAAGALVSAGARVTGAGYTMVWTLGQSTPSQGRMSAGGYRLQGGVVGATGSSP